MSSEELQVRLVHQQVRQNEELAGRVVARRYTRRVGSEGMKVVWKCPSCGELDADDFKVCGDLLGKTEDGTEYVCSDLICLICGDDGVYAEEQAAAQ